jgi:Tfp pilus assembly protein PilF
VRKQRSALLGWCFFGALAPSSSIVPVISEMVAERRMYLALAPVLTLVVLAATFVSREPALRRAAAISCSLIALGYAAASGIRLQSYQSETALFASALSVAPDNPQAMWGLAHAYETQGHVQSAAALYERMAERPYPYVGPASWGTRGLMSLADLQSRMGQPAAAAATTRRALTHDPSSAIARLRHAADAAHSGEHARARSELMSMLEQPFLHDRIQLELGVLALQQGDEASAKAHFAEAMRLSPNDEHIKERIAAAIGLRAGH